MDDLGYLLPENLPQQLLSSGNDGGYPGIFGYSPSNDVETIRETITERTIGDYYLDQQLGKGYFGEVWKAKKLILGQDETVALKIINVNQETIENVQREVEILKRISEPRCQPFLVCYRSSQYLKDQNRFLIEMDLVVGKNLERFIKETPENLRAKYLLLIVKDIVTALQYLHSNEISHNDIKPDNILITPTLKPVLVDFGVSCFSISLCFDKIKCCYGIKGPNLYVSPETIKTNAYYPQSDMWSLGVTCYHVITGSYPFDVPIENVKVLFDNIVKQPLKKLSTHDRTLNYIVNRCLDKNLLSRIKPDEISIILTNRFP